MWSFVVVLHLFVVALCLFEVVLPFSVATTSLFVSLHALFVSLRGHDVSLSNILQVTHPAGTNGLEAECHRQSQRVLRDRPTRCFSSGIC